MSTFDESLAHAGPLLAAWDYNHSERTRMRLFYVPDETVTYLAETTVPLAEHEEFVDRLIAKGIRIGGMYATTLYRWAIDNAGLVIWKGNAVVARRAHPPAGCTNVELFIESLAHRGVRFNLASGEDVLVEESDPTPSLDPAYGDDELLMDTLWGYYLGSHLAVWADVPFLDGRTGESETLALPIARAARALADQLRSGSGEIEMPVGATGRAADIAFHVNPTRGSVDLRVTFSDDGTTSTQLKAGTTTQIAAYLRRVTTPSTVLFAMNGEIEKHRG